MQSLPIHIWTRASSGMLRIWERIRIGCPQRYGLLPVSQGQHCVQVLEALSLPLWLRRWGAVVVARASESARPQAQVHPQHVTILSGWSFSTELLILHPTPSTPQSFPRARSLALSSFVPFRLGSVTSDTEFYILILGKGLRF